MPNPPFGNIYFSLYLAFVIPAVALYLSEYRGLYSSNLKEEEQIWEEIAKSDKLEDAMVFVTKMIAQSETKKDKREWAKIQKKLIELANQPF